MDDDRLERVEEVVSKAFEDATFTTAESDDELEVSMSVDDFEYDEKHDVVTFLCSVMVYTSPSADDDNAQALIEDQVEMWLAATIETATERLTQTDLACELVVREIEYR